MKKSFFVLGVAVAALTSCTNEEVVDMPQSRAIQFGTFVNHSTRSNVTETTEQTLKKFFVFGNYGEDTWTPVYTNVEVTGGTVGEQGQVWTPTQTAYWQKGKKYRFAAYSDGGNQNNNVSFKANDQQLVFNSYTVDNTKDLIVAIPVDVTAKASDNDPVNLSFYHMLSQVKFTFENKDSHDYIMEISDIKVNAVKTTKGTATYNSTGSGAPTIDWDTESALKKEDYDFGTLNDIAEKVGDGAHSTTCFVIPQSNENLEVTFTATFSDKAGNEIAENEFIGKLAYSGTTEGTKQNEWTPGFKYNYTVEINGSTVQPDLGKQVIKFKVVDVDEWTGADETQVTPQDKTAGE
ncbi:fimbrillin family protein [Parabacteroides distasonis]|uniref:fimbrillin family protein n=1 Tax=Parabacteroides distasonis TaxID=823 RepID=UPI001F26CA03|nr:fimbrillin family protein [Parabacteroides distasonis]MCE9042441.1 fimbrillin family protein [Parabacteroides distasonis]